jgi:hypothetical protein
MAQDSPSDKAATDERRRFLRESVRGSVPLLVDWVVNQARGIARLAHSEAAPAKTSAPPQAEEAPPADAKEKLDEHYQEFARDNPDSDPSST